MTDERFDEILKEMRGESAPPDEVAAAKERVWQRLNLAPACAGFRPDFPAYTAGSLTESRRLLLDDHLSRCAECRRLLAESQGQIRVMPTPRVAPQRSIAKTSISKTVLRWAVAAGVVIGGLYLGSDRIDAALAPSGPRATIVAISGDVYRLPQGTLEPGATLSEGEFVRTGVGARAVLRLADGSQVEMNQRTELAVKAAWSGQTLRLDRGDVMVEAAKQRRGHLRVVTRDSVAAVKGTVFEVSSGTAGSVVAVVEGSVAVSQSGSDRLLTKGQHAATNSSLAGMNVRQAVSWSEEAQKYYTILGEFANIEKQLAESSTARTEARLLRYLPDGVQVYFAIPNLSGSLRQAMFQFEQRTRENAVLQDWWTSSEGQDLHKTVDRMQSITPLLGEEIVFVLAHDPVLGTYPLILSEVQSGREASLKQVLDRIAGEHAGDQKETVPYRMTQNLLLISNDAAHVAGAAARLGHGASPDFAAEITRRYQHGAGWLAAIDMTALPSKMRESIHGRVLGLANTRFLFFEQGMGGRPEDNEATLSFDGSRSGIASWLAPAGSSGSADYVSSSAVAVFSASTKNPRQAFDELLSTLGSEVSTGIQRFESETGISIGADIAASLGTDFTLAVERPSIPIPGWVAAFEVVRPGVMDDTIRRLADSFNRHRPDSPQLAIKQEVVNGRTWMSLSGPLATLSWTYDRGYMIASTDRAIATQAIAIRDSGSSLVNSAAFREKFPATGNLHQSGFLWLNPSGSLADLAGLVQNPVLKNLLASRESVLIILDGEAEQIRASSRTRLTSLILNTMLLPGVEGARQ